MKYSINAQGVPEAPGPYSMGTTAGRLIFTAGQVALDPQDPSRLVEGGIIPQMERVIQIISLLLEECDCSLTDVAKATLYLKDLGDARLAQEVFCSHFSLPAPALSIVEVSRLPKDALVEMECIACR